MNAEQLLINFDKTKENIPRQITVAMSTRSLYPELRREYIAGKALNGEYNKIYQSPIGQFEVEGVTAYVESEQDALIVAGSLARYRYSVANGYMFDIGAGLHSMLTQNSEGLFQCYELYSKDIKNGKEEKTGARIICSIATLKKALFGPLVDNNGRAITGAGDIVEKAWNSVHPILDGKVPMPRAYASIHKNQYQKDSKGRVMKDKSGNPIALEPIEALVEGEPVRIYRKVSGARDALIIDLDYMFFPIAIDKGSYKMSGQFLHQVGGLTSFLQLGARDANKTLAKAVDVTTARKIILCAQAAWELQNFAPGIIRETTASNSRVNIILRRNAIADLYPAARDSSGKIRYKSFSDAVSTAGIYYESAINATGIKEELIKRANNGNGVILLATTKGAEFPESLPNSVFIKADRVKLDPNPSWKDGARKAVLGLAIKKLNQSNDNEGEEKTEKAKAPWEKE